MAATSAYRLGTPLTRVHQEAAGANKTHANWSP